MTSRFLLCTMAEQGQKMTKTPLKYHQVGDLFIQIMIRGKKHDDRIVKKKNFITRLMHNVAKWSDTL